MQTYSKGFNRNFCQTMRKIYTKFKTTTKSAKRKNLTPSSLTTMQRYWEPHPLKERTCTSSTTCNNIPKLYKLISYNILAQDLLIEHLQLYNGISNRILHWEYRLQQLKEELQTLQPDILCLQEIQYNHLKRFVQELRATRNFEYIFKKKTGGRTDGCAIIYDGGKFKLEEDSNVEYYTDGVPTLNRENVALMAKFHVRNEISTSFIVATTHLLYNPKREDVRTSQVELLLSSLLAFSLQPKGKRLPILLAGDFNFTSCSNSYKTLTAPQNISQGNETDDNATTNDSFQMEVIDFGKQRASTFQDEWVVVDYILKSICNNNEKSIQIHSAYNLPLVTKCSEMGKLPNHTLGSDHFSLAIIFHIV